MRNRSQPRNMSRRKIRQRLLKRHHEILDRPRKGFDERYRNTLWAGLDLDRRRAQIIGNLHVRIEIEQRDTLAVDRDFAFLYAGLLARTEHRTDARIVNGHLETVLAVRWQ